MDSEVREYYNTRTRDGLVRVISKKWYLNGYSPSYYYDEEKREVRLMNTNYNEIRRFNVPEGIVVFDGLDGKGSS